MEKANKSNIREDWEKVLKTMKQLDESIAEATIENELVPRSLILAQMLNNQFDFIKLEYSAPNENLSEEDFKKSEQGRDKLYKKLYTIFNKLSDEEMLQYIKSDLDDKVSRYDMHIKGLKSMIPENIFGVLELRDEIKFLYDELDVWTGKWSDRNKRQETCDLVDDLCKDLGGHDILLRKYLSENKAKLPDLQVEAKKRLVVVPDGSKRFDFWWWYTIEI